MACLDSGLARGPESAEHAAGNRGLRVVAPIRAGYGETCPHPAGWTGPRRGPRIMPPCSTVLACAGCGILARGADLRHALVRAGVALAPRVGRERFFEQVNAGSPGDTEAFARA